MSVLTSKGIITAIVISVVVGSLIGFGLSYATFQPLINNLQTSNAQLQNTLTNIQKAYASASLRDDKLSDTNTHNVKGTVTNFGSVTASNIVITVKWYKLGTSFHQEIITMSSLEGRAMKEISFSYVFGGGADDFQYTISWT